MSPLDMYGDSSVKLGTDHQRVSTNVNIDSPIVNVSNDIRDTS